MAHTYEISDELKNIQNSLIKNTIKANTNVQLLQSESAVRDLYASYADKIKNVGGKLFDFTNYTVESRDVITKEYFDELFQDLYNDLHALYINIKYIDDILDINLNKNIKFFNTLEKRILELENKLDVARLNVNTIVAFDKVYFEGFNNNNKDSYYTNMDIDKKTGHMLLKPIAKEFLNKKYNIKKVTTTLYPVPNNDGGVIVTTSPLNTFEESYRKDGQNDMLENGLWKEQVYTNEIPDLQIYVNKNNPDGPNFKIQTQGLVSYVDIEFKYLVEFNNMDIDLFGEYDTSIAMILHKKEEADWWNPMVKLKKALLADTEVFVDSYKEESGFNILKFRNFEMINAKFVRIIFNQKNYSLVKNAATNTDALAAKINEDLSERRLDVIKLDGGSDGEPAIPKTFYYDSFSAELFDIIEYSSNVDSMLKNIIEVLEPTPKLIDTTFNKTLKYEVGAWSIEPKLLQYVGAGKYQSPKYSYTEKSVVAISLTTKQEDVFANTCNWYISDIYNRQLHPIIPNDEILRKESINVINNQYYNDLGWGGGTLIQLDFPFDAKLINAISLYEDEREISMADMDVFPLSTRLLYINNITDPNTHKYVIKYIPAKFSTVNVYTLYSNNPYTSADESLEYNIIAPRESILKLFLDKTGLSESYTINRSICTELEYRNYFDKNVKNLCICDAFYNIAEYKTVIDKYLYPKTVTQFQDSNSAQKTYGQFTYDLNEPSAIPITYERVI